MHQRFLIALAIAATAIMPVAASAATGTYPRMTNARAHTLSKLMVNKWARATNAVPEYWWFTTDPCTRLSASRFECTTVVWRNAAGTMPLATLTVDVWNGQVADNGYFFSHEVVANVAWN